MLEQSAASRPTRAVVLLSKYYIRQVNHRLLNPFRGELSPLSGGCVDHASAIRISP